MEQLARQRAAQVAAWRADVGSRPAGEWAQLRDVAVHTTGIPVRQWNGAHVTGSDPDLDAAATWFAARGMPWAVLVPEDEPFDPGTAQITTQRVMLRDLDGLPAPPELELWWDDGDGAVAVQQSVFEDDLTGDFVLPKLRNPVCGLVTAYDGGPVSTATLVVAEGVAAVYGVGTLSSHRGRGLGRAVTLAVLHEGVRRGCDLAFLNPSDLGHGVYRGLGFADAPGWRVHMSIPAGGSSS
ncbi:MAG: family N-acetyltransferase [Frankiales bacterium]|nr:family N-acetyltransferase [Frankiales bacterium]